MKLSSPLRTLGLFTLLSLAGVAQAHAEPVTTSSTPQQVTESGSERATDRAKKLRTEQAQKMAESGGERSHKRATRTGKLRDEQAPIIAEGGSDRLQIWHQQRSA